MSSSTDTLKHPPLEPSSRFWTPSPALDGYGADDDSVRSCPLKSKEAATGMPLTGQDACDGMPLTERCLPQVSERPPIIARLMATRKELTYHPQQPGGFHEFQKHVQENDVQLQRFDFLKMSVFFEGLLIGPSDAETPKDGSRAIEMIFIYYSGRRQADSIVGGKTFTFDDIHEANSTIDMAELNKFMHDFFPGVFTRQEVSWLFKMTNHASNIEDENISALDYEEFLFLLAHIGSQLYYPASAKEIAHRLGKRLGLGNPRAMRKKLYELGRVDAGFGAWKSDSPPKPHKFDRTARHALGRDAKDRVLLHKELAHCIEHLQGDFPVIAVPEWLPFQGKYIAMAFPTHGARNATKPRFKVVLRNMAPRNIQIHYRIENLPMLSMVHLPPAPIAPGMDLMCEIKVEASKPGIHIGGLVFSAEENGPEIFRCPIYLRILNAVKSPIGESLVAALAQHAQLDELRERFHSHDPESSGQVSRADFAAVMDEAAQRYVHQLSEEEAIQLAAEAGAEGGQVDFDDFIHNLEVRREELEAERKAAETTPHPTTAALHKEESSASSPGGKRQPDLDR